jgi:hypothetical protein
MTLEERKKPGVHYAVTKEGIELPVVDVSHPAFATNVTALEQKALVEKFLQADSPFRSLPRPLRNLLTRFLLRGSLLAKGIRGAQGTFLSGMHTYLLKIGPEMLTGAYAGPIDRRIAASLPVLSVRLRLQDVAELMADTLMTALQGDRRRPLTFVNIAGGPAVDSLNTLILLNKHEPGINDERRISIEVLDLDDAGPAFGKSALASLSAPDGPLHELLVSFRHSRYDWAHTENLKSVLRETHDQKALVICSSEGGLFEYGSDSEIENNLAVLRQSDEVLAVVGSVTRADELSRRLRESSSAATHPRGLEVFRSLVKKAGWDVVRAIERPLSNQVVLVPAQ